MFGAMFVEWNELPTGMNRALFKLASAESRADWANELALQISRGLHDHKDDMCDLRRYVRLKLSRMEEVSAQASVRAAGPLPQRRAEISGPAQCATRGRTGTMALYKPDLPHELADRLAVPFPDLANG